MSQTIKINEILSGHNARSKLEGIDELAVTMKTDGLLQPIVVRPSKDGQPWELVAGARRLAAAKQLKWTEIEATVIEPKAEKDRDLSALLENAGREDLPFLDFAEEVERIHTTYNVTYNTIAARVGMSRSHVGNAARVAAKLSPEIKAAARKLEASGKVGPRAMDLIAWSGKKTPEGQQQAFDEWLGKAPPSASDGKGKKGKKGNAAATSEAQSRTAMLEYVERLQQRGDAGKAHIRAAIQAVRWCAGELAQEPRYRAK